MKRYTLKSHSCSCKGTALECDCGGVVKPKNEFEKPKDFKRRQYCCNQCPKMHEWKLGNKFRQRLLEAQEQKERTPETCTDPVNLFLMGKLTA